MRLNQQFNAEAKALIGLDCNHVDDPSRKQPKTAGGVMSWQPGEVVERECCDAHQHGLEPWTAFHFSSRHKAASTNNVASMTGQGHHAINDSRIKVVVGGIYDNYRRGARGKPRHDG